MKHVKKMLSVLLAALMLVSLCSAALAEEDHWIPVHTSSEGLQKGDYYLYLEWLSEITKDWENAWGAETLSEDELTLRQTYFGPDSHPEEYQWFVNFVDYDFPRLRVDLPNGEQYFCDRDWSRFFLIVADWKPVAFSTENLKDGDYYFDLDAYVEYLREEGVHTDEEIEYYIEAWREMVAGFADGYGFSFWISLDPWFRAYVNPDKDEWFRYRIDFFQSGSESFTSCYPITTTLNGDNRFKEILNDDCIKQYHASEEEVPADSGNSGTGQFSFLQKLAAFFQRIIEFFRNLFKS